MRCGAGVVRRLGGLLGLDQGGEDVVDPVEDRRRPCGSSWSVRLSRRAGPGRSGTSRCWRGGSGRSTAWGRRRRTADRRGTSTSRQSAASAAAPPAIRTASSIWIGSVSWNSSSSSRWYRSCSADRTDGSRRSRSRASTRRSWNSSRPSPRRSSADSSTRTATQCERCRRQASRSSSTSDPATSTTSVQSRTHLVDVRPVLLAPDPADLQPAQRAAGSPAASPGRSRCRASARDRGSACTFGSSRSSSDPGSPPQRCRSAQPPRSTRRAPASPPARADPPARDRRSGPSRSRTAAPTTADASAPPRPPSPAATAPRSSRRPAIAAATPTSVPRTRPTTRPHPVRRSAAATRPRSDAPAAICCANECSVPIDAESRSSSAASASRREGPRRAFSNSTRNRSRSSAPAFSVNVTAAIVRSGISSRSTSVVTRSTSACVFPDPAPASTNSVVAGVRPDPLPRLRVQQFLTHRGPPPRTRAAHPGRSTAPAAPARDPAASAPTWPAPRCARCRPGCSTDIAPSRKSGTSGAFGGN